MSLSLSPVSSWRKVMNLESRSDHLNRKHNIIRNFRSDYDFFLSILELLVLCFVPLITPEFCLIPGVFWFFLCFVFFFSYRKSWHVIIHTCITWDKVCEPLVKVDKMSELNFNYENTIRAWVAPLQPQWLNCWPPHSWLVRFNVNKQCFESPILCAAISCFGG